MANQVGIANRAVTLAATAIIALSSPLIARHEGLQLKAYLDPLGIPTACYGSTLDIRLGMTFTKDECDAKLARDVQEALAIVDRHAPGLGTYQRAAFTSFTFNVGPGKPGVKDGFVWLKRGRMTTLLRKLQAGDIVGACNELPKWANPPHLKGLKKRRADEQKLCLTGL